MTVIAKPSTDFFQATSLLMWKHCMDYISGQHGQEFNNVHMNRHMNGNIFIKKDLYKWKRS